MWLPRARPAQHDEGEQCIPFLVEAGGELLAWSVADGGPELATALMRRCWQSRTHPLGAAFTYVIERDDQVIGAITGGDVRRWRAAEQRRSIPSDGLAHPADLREFARRLALQSAARPPLPSTAWYLSSLGIAPSARRRGLGRHLVANAISRANGLQLDGVLIEVVASNQPAVALYTSMGFHKLGDWRAQGGPSVLRLYRPRTR